MGELLLLVAGVAGLALGSGFVVRGALGLARWLRVPPLVVGLTITSVGTSIPEIATNITVAMEVLDGVPASGVAIGNVIGSCLSQITLLLGIAALAGTLTCPRKALRRDGAMLVAGMGAMFLACIDGTLGRAEGILLVSAYLAYLVGVLVQERKAGLDLAPDEPEGPAVPAWRTVGALLFGLVVVSASAHLAVDTAVELARRVGVGASLIGLGVGLGTGLPELVVSVRALREQSGTLGLGNLIGSNITDPLLSAGLGAVVAPLTVPAIALTFDFPFWLAATGVALLLLFNHLDLNPREAGVLFIVFGLFVWVRVLVLAA